MPLVREFARDAQRISCVVTLTNSASNRIDLILTEWRRLTMCQYLLGGHANELEDACVAALEAFVGHGSSAACEKVFEAAGVVIKRMQGMTVLPSIPREKRIAVSYRLEALAQDG